MNFIFFFLCIKSKAVRFLNALYPFARNQAQCISVFPISIHSFYDPFVINLFLVSQLDNCTHVVKTYMSKHWGLLWSELFQEILGNNPTFF